MVLNKHLIRFIYVLIGFLIFINGGSSIILLTQCMPLSSWWNSKWGDCWQGYGYATLGAGIAQGRKLGSLLRAGKSPKLTC